MVFVWILRKNCLFLFICILRIIIIIMLKLEWDWSHFVKIKLNNVLNEFKNYSNFERKKHCFERDQYARFPVVVRKLSLLIHKMKNLLKQKSKLSKLAKINLNLFCIYSKYTHFCVKWSLEFSCTQVICAQNALKYI